MGAALLDVNVLLALVDPTHPNHQDAHRWFHLHRSAGWATCPMTINGCVRVICNPSYGAAGETPARATARLQNMCGAPDHEFWPDEVALWDSQRFRPEYIEGHNQITDVYLLGLAVLRGGRLATFDRRIPLRAVAGAERRHIEWLG